MEEKKERGWEHYDIYKNGFHERLGEDWPEAREQLHSGGWEWTEKLVEECDLTRPSIVCLDLCCGEGSTAIFIAERYGGLVHGIDIVPNAIQTAKKFAQSRGIDNKVFFVEGNIFKLPYPNNFFDVVYGQDPDGLSHPERVHAMKEIYRVLKPGGLFSFHHHWVPGFNFDEKEIERLGEKQERLTADHYVSDVQDAGFRIKIASPIYELAESHLLKCSEIKKQKGKADTWLEARCESIRNGHKYGVKITAIKPLNQKFELNPSTFTTLLVGAGIGAAAGALAVSFLTKSRN